jgi:hypothetical protein
MESKSEFPSISEALDQVELYLSSSLHLNIPSTYPKEDSSRIMTVLKLLKGLDRTIIIEQLPLVLIFLEDKSFSTPIFELLILILNDDPEEIFEALIKSTKNEKIKKNCLEMFKELVEKGNVKGLHRVMHSLAEVINDADKETAVFARSIGRRIRDSIFRTSPPIRLANENGFIFGIIPPQLFLEFSTTDNQKTRLVALKSIEEILCNMPDFETLLPYESELMKMLNQVLMETNKSFVGAGLRIAVTLCKSTLNFTKLFPVLRTKLADSAIPYRKSAFKVILQVLTKSPELLKDLVSGLANENWHVREETLNLFISAGLKGLKFEGIDLIPSLARLLDDEKSKIRQVTEEAFAVFGKLFGQDQLISQLQPIVDDLELSRLKARFEVEEIARLENNLIVFPKTIPTTAPSSLVQGSMSPTASSTFLSKFNGTSYSPTPTSTQEFKFNSVPSTISSIPRSSSVNKSDFSSIFAISAIEKASLKVLNDPVDKSLLKQSSEFLKPPLPKRTPSSNRLPSLQIEETKKSIIDKTYTNWTELEKISNPSEELQKYTSLEEDNWEKQFEAADFYRRVVKFHKEILDSQITHKLVSDLVKWGDSLRSALSKNSIIALGEFCTNLNKFLDPEVESVLTLLLRKSSDTNVFIVEAATEALSKCVSGCSLARVIPCLLTNISAAKSSSVKRTLALCCKCVGDI